MSEANPQSIIAAILEHAVLCRGVMPSVVEGSMDVATDLLLAKSAKECADILEIYLGTFTASAANGKINFDDTIDDGEFIFGAVNAVRLLTPESGCIQG